MIIILEGADGAGKTTLAKLLQEAAGPSGIYLHSSKPKEQWPYITSQIWEILKAHNNDRTVIMDRLWLSDNAYALIDPDPGRAGIHVRRQDSVMMVYGAVNILCAPDPGELVESYKKNANLDEELYGDRYEDIEKVAKAYHDLWDGSDDIGNYLISTNYMCQMIANSPWKDRPLTMLYDRFQTPISTVEAARGVLDAAWEMQRPYDDLLQHIGSDRVFSGSLLDADYVIAVIRFRFHERGYWPAYSMEGNSSLLTRVLHDAGIDESRVALLDLNKLTKYQRLGLDWLKENRPECKFIAVTELAGSVLGKHYEDIHVVKNLNVLRKFLYEDNLSKTDG